MNQENRRKVASQSIVDIRAVCQTLIEIRARLDTNDPAGRHISLAITHLEDARMRIDEALYTGMSNG